MGTGFVYEDRERGTGFVHENSEPTKVHESAESWAAKATEAAAGKRVREVKIVRKGGPLGEEVVIVVLDTGQALLFGAPAWKSIAQPRGTA